MTWDELAIDLLKAAKAMLDTHPRSSASRAYYAAHIALAKVLEANERRRRMAKAQARRKVARRAMTIRIPGLGAKVKPAALAGAKKTKLGGQPGWCIER